MFTDLFFILFLTVEVQLRCKLQIYFLILGVATCTAGGCKILFFSTVFGIQLCMSELKSKGDCDFEEKYSLLANGNEYIRAVSFGKC